MHGRCHQPAIFPTRQRRHLETKRVQRLRDLLRRIGYAEQALQVVGAQLDSRALARSRKGVNRLAHHRPTGQLDHQRRGPLRRRQR